MAVLLLLTKCTDEDAKRNPAGGSHSKNWPGPRVRKGRTGRRPNFFPSCEELVTGLSAILRNHRASRERGLIAGMELLRSLESEP